MPMLEVSGERLHYRLEGPPDAPALVLVNSLMRRTLLATASEGYILACAAARDADQRQRASDVRAPSLVIAGARDRATTPAEGRWLAQEIVGAGYVELPAAHLSNIEAAEPFTQVLLDFLLN